MVSFSHQLVVSLDKIGSESFIFEHSGPNILDKIRRPGEWAVIVSLSIHYLQQQHKLTESCLELLAGKEGTYLKLATASRTPASLVCKTPNRSPLAQKSLVAPHNVVPGVKRLQH